MYKLIKDIIALQGRVSEISYIIIIRVYSYYYYREQVLLSTSETPLKIKYTNFCHFFKCFSDSNTANIFLEIFRFKIGALIVSYSKCTWKKQVGNLNPPISHGGWRLQGPATDHGVGLLACKL